jgi:hypothetical protein
LARIENALQELARAVVKIDRTMAMCVSDPHDIELRAKSE